MTLRLRTPHDSELEQYIDAFMRELPAMLREHEGSWTVFRGDKPLGFYGTGEKAFEAALDAYGAALIDGVCLIIQVSQEYITHGRGGQVSIVPEWVHRANVHYAKKQEVH